MKLQDNHLLCKNMEKKKMTNLNNKMMVNKKD